MVKQAENVEVAASDAGWQEVSVSLGEKIEWGSGGDLTSLFIGTYTGSREEVSSEGEPMLALTFRAHDREYFTWANRELKFAMQAVKVGNLVNIEWLGYKELPGGVNPAHHFRVRTRRA